MLKLLDLTSVRDKKMVIKVGDFAYFGFKHRFNLSRDSRLYKLINEEGARGYGSYLFILEQLYSQESGRLFIGQLKLIRQKGFPQAYLEKIVRNYGLFVIEDDMFSSAIDYLGTSRKKAEVSEACAATPDELVADCLPARSWQAVRKEAKSKIISSPLESYHTNLPSRAREKKRIEKKRIENTSSI